MYTRFTPKQLNILKKILPTCKINAYDIQIFQEILKALENPIDEKEYINNNQVKKKLSSNKPNQERKPQSPVEKPVEPVSQPESEPESKSESEPAPVKEEESVDEVIEQTDDSTANGEEIQEETEAEVEADEKADEAFESLPEPKKEEQVAKEPPQVEVQNVSNAGDSASSDELNSAGIFGEIDRRKIRHNNSDYL